MAFNFNWHRKNISAQEYAENMRILNTSDEKKEFEITIEGKNEKYKVILEKDFLDALTDSSLNSNAYKVASDIRKFEIDKYWQRTLYFWGFISAIYIAYFNVLKEFCCHGDIPLLILSALGLFFSFSWLLTSEGSKHWQENWENHLDLLENNITGPLYKTYSAGNSYSVSQINIMAGRILSLCAYGLLVFEFGNFAKRTLRIMGFFAILIITIFVIVIAISLLVYSKNVVGNTNNSGSISFDLKKYGADK